MIIKIPGFYVRCFLVSLSISMATVAIAQPGKKLPNIIFILADDMGYGDAGCYGQQLIKTPNIDQLAKGGMRFTSFYAGSTVCAPSRASLMTGKHTGHVSVRGNGEVPLPASDTTLPQVLKQQGYATGMVGKWGLGLPGTSGVPEKKGWDFFAGHLHHMEGHFQQPDSAWTIVRGQSIKTRIPAGQFANEWFNNAALEFIDHNKQTPFFLYVSYTLPHAEFNGPLKYLRQYLDANGNSKFAPEKAQPPGLHYGAQPYPKAAYAAMISQMDDYVGSILQSLQRHGLEENTLVIFASDNGTHTEGGRSLNDALVFFKSSGPLRGVKRDLYEGGIRIPFITYWKGNIPANTTTDYSGAFWDVLPTLAELTGAKKLKGDGESMLPGLFSGKFPDRKEPLYWEFYENGFKQAVRKDNWKAIRFYKGASVDRTELYDLTTDMDEKVNLAAQQAEKVTELEQLMDQQHTTSDNPLFRVK